MDRGVIYIGYLAVTQEYERHPPSHSGALHYTRLAQRPAALHLGGRARGGWCEGGGGVEEERRSTFGVLEEERMSTLGVLEEERRCLEELTEAPDSWLDRALPPTGDYV